MWRSEVLHENCTSHKCMLLKCWNDMVEQKRFIACTIDGTRYRISWTYIFENGPTIKDDVPDSNFSLQQAYHKFVMTRVQACSKLGSKLTKAPKSP
ncbi:hypothetical protein AVEN_126353-1 [Araneus ventricosus]|uniref:Uncharacterized protein n=1 Tax=Araneus ventricosus TaxID=182803 RepID=A0A4Y2JS95_ARAVE|nr:hypothetical protein AVEN_126353-1 [Araneus ventricosus]